MDDHKEGHIARHGAKMQVRRGGRSFTPARRQRFFDALALTCNATKAAAHAGICISTVYRHREQDDAFREQWQAALACGCDRLELLVLEHGGAGAAMAPADPERAATDDPALAPFDFERALKVLTYWRTKRAVRTPKSAAGPASRADTNAAIMRALVQVRKRLANRPGALLVRDDG